MKKLKLAVIGVGLLFAIQATSNAQNWGFSLPFGNGGFAINGKNWTAGLGGAVAGGGRGGWGFQLPSGVGFYNGGGPGGGCAPGYGGGGAVYAGGGYGPGGQPVMYQGGSPAPVPENWTGQGGYYSANGWNHGPNWRPGPSGSTPAVYHARWPNGAAVYQSVNGQTWVQQPY